MSKMVMPQGLPDPFASDGVVEIRPYAENLIGHYVELARSVTPNDPSVHEPDFVESLKRWLAGGKRASFSIYTTSSGAFVGACYVHDVFADSWEIGYDVLPEFRNRGYATRASRLLIEGCVRLCSQRRFTARVDARNAASMAVMRKLGAEPVGISRPIFVTDEALEFFDSVKAGDAAVVALASKLDVPPGRLRVCPALFEIPTLDQQITS